MRPQLSLNHQFVETIPTALNDRTLYVCMEYGTVVHLCCCGCGNKVFTPLSPTDWKLVYDGENISLEPSIGNWDFECQSHYWIRRSTVSWASQWSKEEVAACRAKDAITKEKHFARPEVSAIPGEDMAQEQTIRRIPVEGVVSDNFWTRIKKRFLGFWA